VFIGEIGLSGELRPVNHMEARIRRHEDGHTQAVIRRQTATASHRKSMRTHTAAHVKAALESYLILVKQLCTLEIKS
jgi:predicted ATP-dependent serine protease